MKINVAVLFGGKSVEHEVSVISAVQAMQNINKDKYAVYPVYITKKMSFTGVKALKIWKSTKIFLRFLPRARRLI